MATLLTSIILTLCGSCALVPGAFLLFIRGGGDMRREGAHITFMNGCSLPFWLLASTAGFALACFGALCWRGAWVGAAAMALAATTPIAINMWIGSRMASNIFASKATLDEQAESGMLFCPWIAVSRDGETAIAEGYALCSEPGANKGIEALARASKALNLGKVYVLRKPGLRAFREDESESELMIKLRRMCDPERENCVIAIRLGKESLALSAAMATRQIANALARAGFAMVGKPVVHEPGRSVHNSQAPREEALARAEAGQMAQAFAQARDIADATWEGSAASPLPLRI